MRVYVATTPGRVAALREDGLPAGTEGYAATDAFADALGLPRRGEATAGAAEDDDAAQDLTQAVVDTAAEASLLLLSEGPEGPEGPEGSEGSGGPGGAAPGPPAARRAVVVVEARARPVSDAAHPATVVLTAPVRWASVECLLADDETAAGRVGRAAVLARTDQDGAVERLERDQLGWFGRDEL